MTKKKPDLSIVLPCFNESNNMTITIKKIKKIIEKSHYFIEIIVIDGFSTDNTPEELKTIFKCLPKDHFKLILNKKRGGYGNDIMQALSQANGNVLAWTHADLQTDPQDVIEAYELYLKLSSCEETKLFIKGKRKNRRLIETCFSFGMQIVSLLALNIYLSDINAQPKLFSRSYYNKHLKRGYPMDFSLDLFSLYQAKTNGYSIKTVPVYFKKRIHGEAKGGGGGWKMRIKLIKRTFNYIFQLKKNLNLSPPQPPNPIIPTSQR